MGKDNHFLLFAEHLGAYLKTANPESLDCAELALRRFVDEAASQSFEVYKDGYLRVWRKITLCDGRTFYIRLTEEVPPPPLGIL